MFMDQFKQAMSALEEQVFHKYVLAGLIALILAMSAVLFFHQRSIAALKKQASRVNLKRQEVQALLSRYKLVQQQKAEVAAMLEQQKAFKITGYMEELTTRLGLAQARGNLQTSTDQLEHLPEYDEIKLPVRLAAINMRQLAELLRELEKNERIYIKTLDITQASGKQAIDVDVTIATLQARTQLTE